MVFANTTSPESRGDRAAGTAKPLVVAFALDRVLVDLSASKRAAIQEVARQTRTTIKPDDRRTRTGARRTTRAMLARFFKDEMVLNYAYGVYSSYLETHGPFYAQPCAGAKQALTAIKAFGGQSVVVTAKSYEFATATLRHADVRVDRVHLVGGESQKIDTLKKLGAWGFVGVTVGDMRIAQRLGIQGVAIKTNPDNLSYLTAAGATVIDTLVELPPLLPNSHLNDAS